MEGDLGMHPIIHRFIPINIAVKAGRALERPHFSLNCRTSIDAMNPEKTDVKIMPVRKKGSEDGEHGEEILHHLCASRRAPSGKRLRNSNPALLTARMNMHFNRHGVGLLNRYDLRREAVTQSRMETQYFPRYDRHSGKQAVMYETGFCSGR